MTKCFLNILILFTFLTSCASIDDSIFQADDLNHNANLTSFEGQYRNDPLEFNQVKKRGYLSYFDSTFFFWSHFHLLNEYSLKEKKDMIFKLNFENEKKISASLILQDSVIRTKTIRGKWKDGYFYKNAKFFFSPFIPLLFGYNTSILRFGIDTDGNLICENSWNIYMGSFIAGTNSKGQRLTKFKKNN